MRPARAAKTAPRPDPETFIRARLRLAPVPAVPEIRLYTAHPATGLWRLDDPNDSAASAAPYWAFPWAGGMALARHILDHPGAVAGRRVLDIGAGSGLVAIAAARAGAASVTAVEIDSYGVAAIRLNAEANGVAIDVVGGDVTAGPPPDVDLILAGDVFYAPDVAARMTGWFDRCLDAGVEVLVGDPGRIDLPRARLRLLGEYAVGDMGQPAAAGKPSIVAAWIKG